MGITGHFNSGFPGRSDTLSNLQINNGFGLQCNGNSKITPECSTSNIPEIAILGNSYAMVYTKSIHDQSKEGVVQLTTDSCAIGYIDFIKEDFNQSCTDFFNNSIKTIQLNPSIKTVIISSPFKKEFSSIDFKKSLFKLLNDLDGKKLIIIGPTPYAPFHVGECIHKSSYIKVDNDCSFNIDDTHVRLINEMEQNLKFFDNLVFLDVTKIICPNGKCNMNTKRGSPIYLEHGHLTVAGASMVIQELELFNK
jgi:hypothetical protein